MRKTEEKPIEQKIKKDDTRIKSKVKKLTWKESKELEIIEDEIMKEEAEVERIESIFSSPDFYEKYSTHTDELNLQLKTAKDRINYLFVRWEELEELKKEN